MNQLILEKNLQIKFNPIANKENDIQKLYDKPSVLALKLAQETIKKLK